MNILTDLKENKALLALGFSIEVSAFLSTLIDEKRDQAQAQEKPLVIFDCDQTLIQGDLGEVLLRYLWQNVLIKEVGQVEKEAITAVFQEQAPLVLDTFAFALQASNDYFGYLWDLYLYICQEKIEYGYLFAASCMTHFDKEEQKRLCQHVFDTHIRFQSTFEDLKSSYLGIKDLSAIAKISRTVLQADYALWFNEKKELWSAIQPYQAQKLLLSLLQEAQIETAIISSSAQGMVDLMAQYFQIDQAHTIAVAFDQSIPVDPVPINHGKITACEHHFQRLPILMVGDSLYDLPLMSKSKYGLLIDYQKPKVRERVIQLNAFLQPYQSLS